MALMLHLYCTCIARGDDKMPNKDGTGPNGKGPKTGRGNGGCK